MYPQYSCRLCKNFLEEGNFTYAINRHNGNPVLFCNPCREDGEKFGRKEITEEEFRKSIDNRWKEGVKNDYLAALSLTEQGWKVEMIPTSGSKTVESIKCCQLVSWFSDLEEEQKVKQYSSLIFILDNLNKKDKLCPNCLEFKNSLLQKLAN